MKIERLLKEKYGNIKSVVDIEIALSNEDFLKDYSAELLTIIGVAQVLLNGTFIFMRC